MTSHRQLTDTRIPIGTGEFTDSLVDRPTASQAISNTLYGQIIEDITYGNSQTIWICHCSGGTCTWKSLGGTPRIGASNPNPSTSSCPVNYEGELFLGSDNSIWIANDSSTWTRGI